MFSFSWIFSCVFFCILVYVGSFFCFKLYQARKKCTKVHTNLNPWVDHCNAFKTISNFVYLLIYIIKNIYIKKSFINLYRLYREVKSQNKFKEVEGFYGIRVFDGLKEIIVKKATYCNSIYSKFHLLPIYKYTNIRVMSSYKRTMIIKH